MRTTYPFNLLKAVGTFFSSVLADNLFSAVNEDSAKSAGQAYLDVLEAALHPVLKDCPTFSKEYVRLLRFREDAVRFTLYKGAPRYVWPLPPGTVYVPALDNRVVAVSASLELGVDYELLDRSLAFLQDPTDDGYGGAAAGFARRRITVQYPASVVLSETIPIQKGDFVRLLTVSISGQTLREDVRADLVRGNRVYSHAAFRTRVEDPLTAFTVLRDDDQNYVVSERVALRGSVAQLKESRIKRGSLTTTARRLTDGVVSVEGVDYTVDYETGTLGFLTPVADITFSVTYRYYTQVWPVPGAAVPYAVGGALEASVEVSLWEVFAWAPDTLVDRQALADSFGYLIGEEAPSDAFYKAFLQGVVNLYVSGPVLPKFEAALTVALGLPLVEEDGEVLLSVTPADGYVEVTTLTPVGVQRTYEIPQGVPLASAVTKGRGTVFSVGDSLTAAVRVVDYLQDPSWFHGKVIPEEVFFEDAAATPWSPERRIASTAAVEHCGAPVDYACIGDPGLYVGADDFGRVYGTPVNRHSPAFVLFDRYLKYHMFLVEFSPGLATMTNGSPFAKDPKRLASIIRAAKPAHTYAYVKPTSDVRDTIYGADQGYYQHNPDALHGPEVFSSTAGLDPRKPALPLGVLLGAFVPLVDRAVFPDTVLRGGEPELRIGDWYSVEVERFVADFTAGAAEVVVSPGPAGSRPYILMVRVGTTVKGGPLLRGVDYLVDAKKCTLQRVTRWDVMKVEGSVLVLRLWNEIDKPPGRPGGYNPLCYGGTSPGTRPVNIPGFQEFPVTMKTR